MCAFPLGLHCTSGASFLPSLRKDATIDSGHCGGGGGECAHAEKLLQFLADVVVSSDRHMCSGRYSVSKGQTGKGGADASLYNDPKEANTS